MPPQYTCAAPGCPGTHASKYMYCTTPRSMDELPLIDPACQREFARKLRRLIGL